MKSQFQNAARILLVSLRIIFSKSFHSQSKLFHQLILDRVLAHRQTQNSQYGNLIFQRILQNLMVKLTGLQCLPKLRGFPFLSLIHLILSLAFEFPLSLIHHLQALLVWPFFFLFLLSFQLSFFQAALNFSLFLSSFILLFLQL